LPNSFSWTKLVLTQEVTTVHSPEVVERRLRDEAVELLLVEVGGYTLGFVDIGDTESVIDGVGYKNRLFCKSLAGDAATHIPTAP
jgi:hypothetical protein